MNDFVRMVLDRLQSSVVLILLAIPLIALCLLIPYWIYKKKKKPFPWKKSIMVVMLSGYLLALLFLTLIRGGFGIRSMNLHLFRAWREAWNNFSVKSWLHVLLNVGMFVPLGVLLPLVSTKFRRWHWTILSGFGLSLLIELIQFCLGRGVCDVDDLFANTLGCIIGFFAVMLILSLFQNQKNWKPAATYGSLFLVPIIAVSGIFAAYEIKEYGNLADAPTYTNKTAGVTWSLDCKLPDAGEQFAVFRTQTLTTEQCDALAENLASKAGSSVAMTTYYQEMAYYNLQHGYLSVDFFGGGYSLVLGSAKEDETTWIETDRHSLESALKKYSVMVPEPAALTYEGEGWHSFTIDRMVEDPLMLDGKVRVRYAPDGEILAIVNELLSYTYYDTVSVISPEEAYLRLCAGKFRDEGYFERKAPKEISVTDCVLDFEIDTKGFCQPVYRFTVEGLDTVYHNEVMIPAMQ